MPRLLTKEQRTFLLKQWWVSGKKFASVDAAFRNEYPGEEVPTRQTIYRLAENFYETGSVEDAPRSGRPTTVRTEENAQTVYEAFRRNPQTSQRRASRDLNI
jgi:hypothetical protein